MHLTKFYCFVIISSRWNAVIAQMVERILGKDEVAGSIPASSSRKRKDTHLRVFSFSMKFVPCGTSEILLRNMKYASRMKYAYGI